MNKRRTDIVKFIVYFLLFAIILYMEKSMIEMQPGSSINDKDRSGGMGFVAILGFIAVVPFYILYDIGIHKQLYRLIALLLQTGFCLWSVFWFRSLEAVRHNLQYENMVSSNGLMPVDRENFYHCWTVGYGVILYLTVVMIVSYVWKKKSV